MIDKDLLFAKVKEIAATLDRTEFPELYAYVNSNMEDDVLHADSAYRVASALVECDKPRPLPDALVRLITSLYEVEIAEGNHYAMNDLGARYYSGDRGFAQSFEKAVRLYHMAAENGNRQAQENLGYCYYYGRNVERDYEKAFQYFALGAFDGHLISLYKIGDMYLNGHYVQKNEKEAFIIYNHCLATMTDEAAQEVSGPIHLRLGDMYLKGQGTEQNPRQALLHYSAAEIMLYQMVLGGNFMYKRSLQRAIEGQERARKMLDAQLPEQEWTFDG